MSSPDILSASSFHHNTQAFQANSSSNSSTGSSIMTSPTSSPSSLYTRRTSGSLNTTDFTSLKISIVAQPQSQSQSQSQPSSQLTSVLELTSSPCAPSNSIPFPFPHVHSIDQQPLNIAPKPQPNKSASQYREKHHLTRAFSDPTPPSSPSSSHSLSSSSSSPSSTHNSCLKGARKSLSLDTASAITTLVSPTSPVTPRKLVWADDSGRFLCKEVLFWKDDEPWRCNRRHSTPLLQGLTPKLEKRNSITSSVGQTSCVSSTPTLEFTNMLPSTQKELTAALGDHGVQLESVMLRSPMAFCTVRVSNICYQKKVFVRVSSDNWQTHQDHEASYLQGSSDGLSDRFYATFGMPNYSVCKSLQFAICFNANGTEYWDNNNGKNYEIRLLPPPSLATKNPSASINSSSSYSQA